MYHFKQFTHFVKGISLALVFICIATFVFAQNPTVTITGPTTCALANTMVPYTVTVTFPTNPLGIPAVDFCACSYIIISAEASPQQQYGEIFINGVSYKSKAILTESNCEFDPAYDGSYGPVTNGIKVHQATNSTYTTWIYNIFVKWNVPKNGTLGSPLTATYKCDNYTGAASLTTELFPRKPTLTSEKVNCSTTKLKMSALGTIACNLGSAVGYQVEESLNGGNTWSVIFNQLPGVPRNQNYSPSNPAANRKIRCRMYGITSSPTGPVTSLSEYSDLINVNIDTRPTEITGPSYFNYGNYTPFYQVPSAGSNNVFSFGGTGGGVNVSFLTSPNSSGVQLNVPATPLGGYFTLVSQGTATCGDPYYLTKGVVVYGQGGFTNNRTEDRAENTQSLDEQDGVRINYNDRQLEISTANTDEKILSIVSMDGRIMMNQSFPSETFTVELNSDFKPGIYVVHVMSQGKISNKKIVLSN